MFGLKFTQRFRDFKNLFQDCDVIHLEKERKKPYEGMCQEQPAVQGDPAKLWSFFPFLNASFSLLL